MLNLSESVFLTFTLLTVFGSTCFPFLSTHISFPLASLVFVTVLPLASVAVVESSLIPYPPPVAAFATESNAPPNPAANKAGPTILANTPFKLTLDNNFLAKDPSPVKNPNNPESTPSSPNNFDIILDKIPGFFSLSFPSNPSFNLPSKPDKPPMAPPILGTDLIALKNVLFFFTVICVSLSLVSTTGSP